jgi:hypothetical protein
VLEIESFGYQPERGIYAGLEPLGDQISPNSWEFVDELEEHDEECERGPRIQTRTTSTPVVLGGPIHHLNRIHKQKTQKVKLQGKDC